MYPPLTCAVLLGPKRERGIEKRNPFSAHDINRDTQPRTKSERTKALKAHTEENGPTQVTKLQ